MKETIIHPLGLAAVLILGVMTLVLPRKWTLLPMFLTACFICQAQQVVVFGLTFTVLRLMVLFGAARLFLRAETRGIRWRAVDTLIILWALSGTVGHTLLLGTFSAFQNRLGNSFDSLGMYFLFRFLIRDWEDLDRFLIGCLITSIPVALAFLQEHATGRNMFAVFGGVPPITVMREGRLRCQGAFSHAILAGCFWASLLPPMAGLLQFRGPRRQLAIVGLAACVVIIVTCASSTPIAAVMFASLAMALFPVRANIRWIRWATVFVLTVLHLYMKQPVWHLVSRIDFAGGSTGWHRFLLIDQSLRRLGEWWLVGTLSTAHWGEGLEDITNQYILEGVRGGLLTLVLFNLMIFYSFRSVGRIMQAVALDRYKSKMAWFLGASLFVHCTNFIGVSYFGQIIMLWYLALAVISSLDALETSMAESSRRPAHGIGRPLSPAQRAARGSVWPQPLPAFRQGGSVPL